MPQNTKDEQGFYVGLYNITLSITDLIPLLISLQAHESSAWYLSVKASDSIVKGPLIGFPRPAIGWYLGGPVPHTVSSTGLVA